MAQWRLSAAARNHKGIVRQNNEDNFYLNGRWLTKEAMTRGGRIVGESAADFQLYAVCDGMGGEAFGEQASLAATLAMCAFQAAHVNGATESELMAALRSLSDRVLALAQGQTQRAGTTLTAFLWRGGRFRVINVGDSRVYRLRGCQLTQLTVDHSAVQKLVELGMLTPEQARVSPKRHLISQYVGMSQSDPDFKPYLSPSMPAMPGDCYLLCSDGLYDMVEHETLRRTLLRARTAAEAVDLLVQLALDNGGRDNVTALCVWVEGAGGVGLAAWLARQLSRLRGKRYP